MDRALRYEGRGGEDRRPPAEVPIGWQRRTHQCGVVYISPSGSVLACLEQVKSYLLTDGTCKCGLECPLIIHKIFNFDPGAAVKQRTAEDARADADVTKLCIHKRKIIAVATLHRSMDSPLLPSGGTGIAAVGPLGHHHALRNNMHNGPPNSVALDNKNPYKMSLCGQRYYQHELASPPPRDPYSCHGRPRVGGGGGGGGDHQRSPYRGRHSVLLSPPPCGPCGPQHYGDGGAPSPRADALRSPDPSSLCYRGAPSPGPAHVNGERFAPLTPPGLLLRHGSPPAAQPSCAMAGRTNAVPLSPAANAKSPNVQRSPCGYAHAMEFQQHQPRPAMPRLPPCVLQKKQVTSEKDPLGILDPIPSKAPNQDVLALLAAQPQVPSVNVHIPPSIVPLPSNLPLPTAKSALVGHGQRVPHPPPPPPPAASSSLSSSPITSPVQAAAAGPGWPDESPHRSRCSSASSEHGGGYAVPSCGVGGGGGPKLPPPRSPRASLGSPRPPYAPGPAYKQDALQLHLKDAPSQLLGGMSGGLGRQPGAMCPAGSEGVVQGNHQGAMALNQNPASFPASSLLSAAAKAQLVNQNKDGGEAAAGGAGHPGLVGGGRGGSLDGHGALNPRYGPGAGSMCAAEGQSGRAALRDKLMAQQREALRKRKQPAADGGGGAEDNAPFGVVKHQMGVAAGGPGASGYAEPVRRGLQQGGLAPNASMAQLLQSMSHQSAHNGPAHLAHHHHPPNARSGKSPFFEDAAAAPPMAALQSLQPHQLQGRTTDVSGCQNFNSDGRHGNLAMEHFAGQMSQMQDPAVAGGFGPMGYGGGHDAVGPMGNLTGPHRQQFGHYQKPSQGNLHFRDRPGLPPMMSNGGVQTYPESGESGSLSCDLRQAQEDSLQSLLRSSSHATQQSQQLLGRGQPPTQGPRPPLQGQRGAPPPPHSDGLSSSSPMDSLLQNFQVGLSERVPLPSRTVISRPGVMLPPSTPHEAKPEYQAVPGARATEVSFRAPAGAASKTTPSVITSMASVGMFADPVVAGQPADLSRTADSVIRGPPRSYHPEPERRQSRVGRPRKNPEKTAAAAASPAASGAPVRLRAPRRGSQRRQWAREAELQDLAPWCGDPLLHQHPLDLNRNGFYLERPNGHPNAGPQEHAPPQFNSMYPRNGLFNVTHMNGGGGLPTGRTLPKHLQPPEGFSIPDANFIRDYGHYNGHMNGHPNGHYNGHYNGHLNGHCAPSASEIRGRSGEEDLRLPDPLFSGEGLHHKPRIPQASELVWGSQGKGTPSRPGKMGSEGHMYLPGVLNSIQGKVESEKLHRTLVEDLEALHKANKIHRNGMELNHHLEAAIQDAMSELDKLTGNVLQMSQRDRQAKTPTPKRRKISR